MRLSTKQLYPLILALASLLLLSAPLKSETVDKIVPLDNDNVDTFLIEMISEYQRFQNEVIEYRRFYEERGDHRGYMVWRQNAFSPTVRDRNVFYQTILEQNRAFIEGQKLEAIFGVFDSLERFSIDVMQAFVEQDIQATANARSTLAMNREQIEKLKHARALVLKPAK